MENNYLKNNLIFLNFLECKIFLNSFLIFHNIWEDLPQKHTMYIILNVLILRTSNVRKRKWNCFDIHSLGTFIQVLHKILNFILKKCPNISNAILTIILLNKKINLVKAAKLRLCVEKRCK